MPVSSLSKMSENPKAQMFDELKDARTVLEKNPTYWQQGRPHLDRVVLRPIPVDSTRLAELRSGGVQIAEALPLQDIRRLRQGRDLRFAESGLAQHFAPVFGVHRHRAAHGRSFTVKAQRLGHAAQGPQGGVRVFEQHAAGLRMRVG